MRQAFAQHKKAPLYVLSTGGGKTVTYAAIAEGAQQKGRRVVILEHRKELIRQASLAIGGLGVRHQIIAPDKKIMSIRQAHVDRLGWPMIDKDAHVAVASVQTLSRRMQWLADFDPDLIVIDEAHHAVAGTWQAIIAAQPRALLLGVTATPCRGDGRGLGIVAGGCFDSMILGPSMRELVAMGYLCPFRVFAPPMKADLSSVQKVHGDFDQAQQADILDSPTITGDAIQHYREITPGKPAIVFCATLLHCEHVAAAFRTAGYRFEVIHGEMEDADRDRLIYGLEDGTFEGLVNVDLIGEGTDIPRAEVAILLRMTESEGKFLQQVGRVGRPYPEKEYGYVLDHVGNTLRHGLPDMPREWSLNGRKKKKKKDAADNVPIMQCPDCFAVHEPRPICPECGHVYKASQIRLPKEVEGTLVEITDSEQAEARAAARRAQASAKTASDLMAAGMTSGRANHILAARQEKSKLQDQLRDLIKKWAETDGRTVFAAWGFMMSDVNFMKPKQLRETIERFTETLFGVKTDSLPQLPPPITSDPDFVIRKSE